MALIEQQIFGEQALSRQGEIIVATVGQQLDGDGFLKTAADNPLMQEMLFQVDRKLGLALQPGDEPLLVFFPLEASLKSPYLDEQTDVQRFTRESVTTQTHIGVCISVRPEPGKGRLLSAFSLAAEDAEQLINALITKPQILSFLQLRLGGTSTFLPGEGLRVKANKSLGGFLENDKLIAYKQ